MIRGVLAERVARLTAERVPFVLATVVHARRPTSVRPGDAALVTAGGTIDGFVGGVCAESSVRLHALRTLETGEPLLLRLVPGDEETETAPDAADGAIVERNPCLSGGALEIFLEPQLPSFRVVVAGDAPIARAVEELARAASYEVARSGSMEPEVHPGDAAVIVASHGAGEERLLTVALQAGVPYVALVASRRRGEAVRAALEIPDELRSQLHTPAGIDIGARTPPEIAISILAELVRVHRSQPPPEPLGAPAAADPVCGMQVVIDPGTPSLEAGGGRVYFCGQRCRDAYAGQHAGETHESR